MSWSDRNNRGGHIQNAAVAPDFENNAAFNRLLNELIGIFDAERDANPVRAEAFMFYGDGNFDNPEFAELLALTSWCATAFVEMDGMRHDQALSAAVTMVAQYGAALVGLNDNFAARSGAGNQQINDMVDVCDRMEKDLMPALDDLARQVMRNQGGAGHGRSMHRGGGGMSDYTQAQSWDSNNRGSRGAGWMSQQQDQRHGHSSRGNGRPSNDELSFVGSRGNNRPANNGNDRHGRTSGHRGGLMSRLNGGNNRHEEQEIEILPGMGSRAQQPAPRRRVVESFGGDDNAAELQRINNRMDEKRQNRDSDVDDVMPLFRTDTTRQQPRATSVEPIERMVIDGVQRVDSRTPLDPNEWKFFTESLFDLSDVVAIGDPESLPLSNIRINGYSYLWCKDTWTQLHAQLTDGTVVHIYRKNQQGENNVEENSYLDHELDPKARAEKLASARQQEAAQYRVTDEQGEVQDEASGVDILKNDAAGALTDVIIAGSLSEAETRHRLIALGRSFDYQQSEYFFQQEYTVLYDKEHHDAMRQLMESSTLSEMASIMQNMFDTDMDSMTWTLMNRRFTTAINQQLQDAYQLDWTIDSFTTDIDDVVVEMHKDFGEAVGDNFNGQAYRLVRTALGHPTEANVNYVPDNKDDRVTDAQDAVRSYIFNQQFMVVHVPKTSVELNIDHLGGDVKTTLVGDIQSKYSLAGICSEALLRSNVMTECNGQQMTRAIILVTSDQRHYRITASQMVPTSCVISDASGMIAETY